MQVMQVRPMRCFPTIPVCKLVGQALLRNCWKVSSLSYSDPCLNKLCRDSPSVRPSTAKAVISPRLQHHRQAASGRVARAAHFGCFRVFAIGHQLESLQAQVPELVLYKGPFPELASVPLRPQHPRDHDCVTTLWAS